MERVGNIVLLAILGLGFAFCDGGEVHSPEEGICVKYAAACPGDQLAQGVLGNCDDTCADQISGKTPIAEPCVFMACALEVGKCDNEEEGDASILACLEDHGWLDQL